MSKHSLVVNISCHIVALARTEKFKTKGFIPEETLVANNRTGRRKVQTLAGTEANLTQNKTLKYTYRLKENKFNHSII
jgi:hypothetical protein